MTRSLPRFGARANPGLFWRLNIRWSPVIPDPMLLVALLAVAPLGRPCLPTELGHTDPPGAAAQLRPPPPPPPPPAPALASPLTREERAQYRIAFGILGQLGQLTISQSPAGADGNMHITGQAHGSLLGLGETDKRLETELDPRALSARRWVAVRTSGGKSVTDFAQQPQPGMVAMLRRRTGKPDRPAALRRGGSVLDPLTFLLRLRVAPPAAPQRYEVIDGQGLWVISMAPTRTEPDGAGRALRLEGKADPITWEGTVDKERSSHAFTLWLTADEYHTPLRLVMPLAVGEARADLVGLSRGRTPSRVTPHPLTRLPQLRWLASP
jgi:hypothetical protein